MRKSKPNSRKNEIIKTLEEKLAKSKAFFLTEYRGLTHQQLEGLRKSLKKIQSEYVVVKNSLMKIAMEKDAKTQSFKEANEKFIVHLKNPTAALFAYGDEISAIKELSIFIKSIQLPKIKIGFFGDKVATEADFNKLATIPAREILLATLASRIQSPIARLPYALNWNLQKLVIALNNTKIKKNELSSRT